MAHTTNGGWFSGLSKEESDRLEAQAEGDARAIAVSRAAGRCQACGKQRARLKPMPTIPAVVDACGGPITRPDGFVALCGRCWQICGALWAEWKQTP
jgi:hypothetical protein